MASSRTLRIFSIPKDVTDDVLKEAFDEFGPSCRCFVVKKKKRKVNSDNMKWNLGYVEFLSVEDAASCLEHTQGHLKIKLEKDREVTVGLQATSDEPLGQKPDPDEAKTDYSQRRFDRQAALKKKARLIVRNLSFKASDADLKNHFKPFGTVVDTQIPTKPDGKRIGPAFIQFSTVAEAVQAIKKLNGSSIHNRKIAVDWAVSKKEFQASNPVRANVKEKESDGKDLGEESMEEDDDEEEEEESSNEDGSSSGEEDSDSDNEAEHKTNKAHNLKTGHDINEGRTIFVRNLSFDSDEQDLRDLMEENFGRVLYTRLVIDKLTEHPRGTAFVKFIEAESAKKCIEASEGVDGLWLDDRQFYACMAMTKEDADTAKEKKKEKVAKDSRNLHLAVEGLIRKGTQAAIGVSDGDMEKRAQVEKTKRNMLKNLNVFISPLRLCVRNIPLNYTDARLKKLFLKHSDTTCKITECKIMRDLKSQNGKSKGYGFVAFSKHDDALCALREMNNNPVIFGKNTRPIIEFSLENRKAVNARIKRLEKSRENNPLYVRKDNKKKTSTPFQRKDKKDQIADKPAFMGTVNNPKQRKMPSHMGEKIRHNRSKVISRSNIKKNERAIKNSGKRKLVSNANDQSEEEPKKKRKNKRLKTKQEIKDLRDEKQFSDLVNKYKAKMSDANQNMARKKWFDA